MDNNFKTLNDIIKNQSNIKEVSNSTQKELNGSILDLIKSQDRLVDSFNKETFIHKELSLEGKTKLKPSHVASYGLIKIGKFFESAWNREIPIMESLFEGIRKYHQHNEEKPRQLNKESTPQDLLRESGKELTTPEVSKFKAKIEKLKNSIIGTTGKEVSNSTQKELNGSILNLIKSQDRLANSFNEGIKKYHNNNEEKAYKESKKTQRRLNQRVTPLNKESTAQDLLTGTGEELTTPEGILKTKEGSKFKAKIEKLKSGGGIIGTIWNVAKDAIIGTAGAEGIPLLSRIKNWISPTATTGEEVAGTAADVGEVAGTATDVGEVAGTAADVGEVAGTLGVAGGLEEAGAAADVTGVGAPVGVILGVAGAAVAAGAVIYKYRKQIGNTLDTLGHNLEDFGKTALTTTESIGKTAWNTAKTIGGGIFGAFKTVGSDAQNLFNKDILGKKTIGTNSKNLTDSVAVGVYKGLTEYYGKDYFHKNNKIKVEHKNIFQTLLKNTSKTVQKDIKKGEEYLWNPIKTAISSDKLLKAQRIVESGGNKYAKSNVGATGLAQFMPGTWSALWQHKKTWWEQNNPKGWATAKKYQEEGTTPSMFSGHLQKIAQKAYMTHLLHLFGGSYKWSLAAYNEGEGSVGQIYKNTKGNFNVGYSQLSNQTQNYVKKVETLADTYEKKSKIPKNIPNLVTDHLPKNIPVSETQTKPAVINNIVNNTSSGTDKDLILISNLKNYSNYKYTSGVYGS